MGMTSFVTQTLPYVTVALFFGGWGYRLTAWWRMRPSRTLVLFPVRKKGSPTVVNIFRRAFTFGPTYSADRILWISAALFLIGLFVSVFLHAFINYPLSTLIPASLGIPRLWAVFPLSETIREGASYLLGSLSAFLVVGGVLIFLYRRLTIPEVRYLSTLQEYASLVFLLIIVSIGTYMRVFSIIDHAQLKVYIAGLYHWQPVPPPESTIFLVHITLAQIYLMTLPFSKAAHSIGTIIIQKIEQWR